MPWIKLLDSITVPADQRRAAEEALKERQQKFTGKGSVDNTTPIVDYLKIEIEFRVLQNIEGGRYLIPDENCTIEAEKLDSLEEEYKASSYWVSYHNHNGTEMKSTKQSYIKTFQVEENPEKPGKMLAKTDLDHKILVE